VEKISLRTRPSADPRERQGSAFREHLIALRIGFDGETEESYNGPGTPVWDSCGKMQINGARPISVYLFQNLNMEVGSADRIIGH